MVIEPSHPDDAAAPAYGRVAVLLHWLLAAAIVGSFAVGSYMVDLPFSPQRLKLYNWHKWAGVLILGASALRLLWRLRNPPPPPPPMPQWQHRVAEMAHRALYLLFFAVPLAGWAYSSAAGFPIVVFGLLPLPDFVPKDAQWAEWLKPWHGRLAWALALVVVLHVAGAMKHHFIDRDGLLRRMAWSRS